MEIDECLDGNAAAGMLSQIFSLDVTSATLTCDDCEHEGPIGELRLYGKCPGQVLRCRSCGAVNLRALEIRGRLVLDLRGATRLVFALPSVAGG